MIFINFTVMNNVTLSSMQQSTGQNGRGQRIRVPRRLQQRQKDVGGRHLQNHTLRHPDTYHDLCSDMHGVRHLSSRYTKGVMKN